MGNTQTAVEKSTPIVETVKAMEKKADNDEDLMKSMTKALDYGPYLPTEEADGIPSSVTFRTVMTLGLIVYVLAVTLPAAILVLTLVLAKLLPYMYRTNDSAVARRKAWVEWTKSERCPKIWKDIMVDDALVIEEKYWINSRGMALMTITTLPAKTPIKGVVCSCHGYTENAGFLKRFEHAMFAKAGYAVLTIEYEGHGRSDGDITLVTDFQRLCKDVSEYFTEKLLNVEALKGKRAFLMGESMGGAVAYTVYNINPKLYSGVIFYAPMLKIADEMKPPQFVIDLILLLVGEIGSNSFVGTLPLSPTADIQKAVFKETRKRYFALNHPLRYSQLPRLATSRELIEITNQIEKSMETFEAPFLLLHGGADTVTDPNLSKEFYKRSCSNDKTFHLYDGMWHSLIHGEPKENGGKVMCDIIKWLNTRV
eukprot:CAMPEP_0116070220 /NCGR_PEP_ID=MMETSP0322-20121206/12869_1 /TAXON_ID=163516 /ORGANISM="Leptocylindrus danicus var. apora, Strain B651" /LENGTH=424 /DNA_ID=CAMNT_0003557965 /DNA_START=29 /DNA_END=1303 /DNA_ORIENTATION=-